MNGLPTFNPRKLSLAGALDRVGAPRALLAARSRWLRSSIRAVNYHCVPPSCAAAFEAQLAFLADRFTPVGRKELLDLQQGHWPHARPGILLSFDDGCRSHAEVVAPRLEAHGLTGWFFLPTDFPDVPVDEQAAYADAHRICTQREIAEPRLALSWEQVRALDERHQVGCHTRTHQQLGPGVDPSRLREEIVGSKRRLEQVLDHEVDAFAWVGGGEPTYSAEAARIVRAAGFRFSFMTNHAVFRPGGDLLQIQRTTLEVNYPPEMVCFQLCGVMDLLYTPRRRRIERLARGDA